MVESHTSGIIVPRTTMGYGRLRQGITYRMRCCFKVEVRRRREGKRDWILILHQ